MAQSEEDLSKSIKLLKEKLALIKESSKIFEKTKSSDINVYREEREALEKVLEAQVKYRNELRKGSNKKNLKAQQRALEDFEKSLKDATERAEELNSALSSKDVLKIYTLMEKKANSIENAFDRQGKVIKDTVGSLFLQIQNESKDALNEIFKKRSIELKIAIATGDYRKAKASALDLQDLHKSKETALKHAETLETARVPGLGRSQGAQLFTGAREGVRNIKNPKELEGLSTALKLVGKQAGSASILFKTLADGLSLIGKIGGPILLIASAVTALVKVINNFDKMMKELNQNATKMAGAISGINDPGKFFKQFNDALFDVKRNLELGLNSKEVSNYFRSLNDAGLSLQGVEKRIGSFGKAIELGRRLSIEFGEDFETFGGFMVDQMLDMRSSIDDVGKSFSRMSKDASQAGISSQKFYQSINASVSALGFYGKFLDNASASMKNLTESRVVGYKEAEKLTTDLLNTFKNMSLEQKGAILTNKTVGPLLEKAAQDLVSQLSKKLNLVNEEVSRTTNPAELLRLSKDAQAIRADISKASIMADKNTSPLDKAAFLEVLSPMMGKVVNELLGSLHMPGIGSDKGALIVEKVLGELLGLGKEQVSQLRIIAKTRSDEFTTALDSITRSNDTNASLIENNIDSILQAMGESGPDGYKDLIKALSKAGFKDGIPQLANAIKEIPEVAEVFKRFNSLDAKGRKEALSNLRNSSFVDTVGKRSVENITKPENVLSVLDDPESAKRQDKIIKAITPLEKLLGIGKESVIYNVASSKLQETIAESTYSTAIRAGAILDWLKHKKSPDELKKEYGSISDKISTVESGSAEFAESLRALVDKNGKVTQDKSNVRLFAEIIKTFGGNVLKKKGELTASDVDNLVRMSKEDKKQIDKLRERKGEIEIDHPEFILDGSESKGTGLIPPPDSVPTQDQIPKVLDSEKSSVPSAFLPIPNDSFKNLAMSGVMKSFNENKSSKPLEQNFTFNVSIQSDNGKEIADYLERHIEQKLRSKNVS